MVDGTNWIGTDVPETFNLKIEAARQRGLGGLMVGSGWRLCVMACCVVPWTCGHAYVEGLKGMANSCIGGGMHALNVSRHALFAISAPCSCSCGRLTWTTARTQF